MGAFGPVHCWKTVAADQFYSEGAINIW